MRLVVFDMDGVIFEGANFWLEFNYKMNTADKALALWKEFGKTNYIELSRLTAALWKGLSSCKYFEMISRRKYTRGIDKLISSLRREEFKTAIVSSGSWNLAMRAKVDLGIDLILANKLGIDKFSCFDGTVDIQVDDNAKDVALARIQSELMIGPSETMVIGDTASDVQMSRLAAYTIGFRVRDHKARAAFDHLIFKRSFEEEEVPFLKAANG